METLVTGGAGFIGSHLVDELLARGHEVKVLDNLHSGSLQNIRNHMENPSLQFLKSDIRNKTEVEKAIRGVDVVFHEAAITSVPTSVKDPQLTEEVNLEGTRNLLKQSLAEGVERFIFASTCAVYGEAENLPIKENSQLKPISPYAESKLAAEKECIKFTKQERLKTVILRYFNAYGPRQGGGKYSGVISKFIERSETGETPIIYGDGKQTRDFVYVKDIVKANLLSLDKREAVGQVFNVGSGKGISIKELLKTILELTERSEIKPVYEDPRANDIRHSEADLSKINKKLGYEPQTSLKEGLKELIESR